MVSANVMVEEDRPQRSTLNLRTSGSGWWGIGQVRAVPSLLGLLTNTHRHGFLFLGGDDARAYVHEWVRRNRGAKAW